MGDYICSAIPSVIDDRDYAVCVRQPVTLPLRYRQSIPTNYHQEAGNCVMQSMLSLIHISEPKRQLSISYAN